MSSPPGWKKLFVEGIERFRREDLDGALKAIDEAIRLADGASYALYDSRAAVYEKQNRLKDALRDAKKTIDIAPTQWHGYFRSARLFASLNKPSAALRMCSLALEHLGDDAKNDGRRRELTALRRDLAARTKCPIAGMPVELLLMVFDLACRPVTLSFVCHRWREIALSHPELWHSLVLAESPKKALRKAQEWRRRSRGRVAELTVRESVGVLKLSGGEQMVHPEDLAMRDEILAELRRLDLAHVKTCHLEDVDVALFLAALWGDKQGLETLSVSQPSRRRGTPLWKSEYGIPSWANKGALRIINNNWMMFTVFVRGLTSFEFDITGSPVDFQPIRYLLQANPALEKLVIRTNTTFPPHANAIPEPLVMAHLRHVELSSVNLSPQCTLNLSLPSLQVLRLSQLPGQTMVLENLVEDPGTSFSDVVELTIKKCSFQTTSLTLALFCAPRLEVLQIEGHFDANAVAESLSSPRSTLPLVLTPESRGLVPTELPILCPSLIVLDLSGSPSLKTGPVMRLVKERVGLAASQDSGIYRLPGEDNGQRVSCIQTLRIDECAQIEAEMLPWFRKNVPQFSCRYTTRRVR